MRTTKRARALATIAVVLSCIGGIAGQTHGVREDFTAVAIASDEFGSGAGTVLMRITRWSTEAERTRLVNALQQKGSRALLDELNGQRPVGTIRTPDSLAYDLRYAHQAKGEDGGRQIIIATDRPIGFWESASSA